MKNVSKCNKCGKSITKKMPGLECRSCGKVTHANHLCSGLAAKELIALQNTDSIDWNCEVCIHDSPHRKSSFVIPDEAEDEEEPCENIENCMNSNKFLIDITSEMTKVLKKLLQPIEISLAACCDKIDMLAKTVESHTKDIKNLDIKHLNLKQDQEKLHLEVMSLKQSVCRIDQQNLDNILEVSGVPVLPDENLQEISCRLASALNVNKMDVSCIKRMKRRDGQDAIIHLSLQQVQQAEQWARAARKKKLLVENIIRAPSSATAKSPVVLRRALTKFNKSLLWQAQQKLKPTYKYVWFQDGKILTRKDDSEKPLVIKSEDDLYILAMHTN